MKATAKKYIIFSAPSGSGKTTLVKKMMELKLPLEFSISATSRQARSNEKHGQDYFFLSPKEFKSKIENKEFIEWEEVYNGVYYGTLKSEINRIHQTGKVPVFDLDVVGGKNLKNKLGSNALSIFIKVNDLKQLEERLINRGTDDPKTIQTRIDKALYETTFEKYFDLTIINDKLDVAVKETYNKIKAFIDES